MIDSPERSYFLLMTPLDHSASTESLIRNYAMVIQNRNKVLPELPAECVIELFAGGTPHNKSRIPLLGVHTPTDQRRVLPDPMVVQDWIDEWFSRNASDTIQQLLDATTIPSWTEVLENGPYPFRSDKNVR